MIYILFNPFSGKGESAKVAYNYGKKISVGKVSPKDIEFIDITKDIDCNNLMHSLKDWDKAVIVGGDGTLNHFVNDVDNIEKIENEIFYLPSGTGNDFMRDVSNKGKDEVVKINRYLCSLPTVTVNGSKYRFINAIGYGLDGFCCAEKVHLEKENKKTNYASIAAKGLLYNYSPVNATVTVDGETENYENVWFAPTMNGMYYGGGLPMAPMQWRLNPKRTLTSVVIHNKNRFKLLKVFPAVFSGSHIKYNKLVSVASGHIITVEFDRPADLQIDGELFRNITEYTVESALARQGKKVSV